MSLEGLLTAARESPEDDLPRLALADWLEEDGQADRAELTRLQVERGRLDRPLRDVFDKRLAPPERERELGALLQESAGAWRFERGLVCASLKGVADVSPQLEALLRQGWVEKVYLKLSDDLRPSVELGRRLAGVPHLEIRGGDPGTDLRPLLDQLHGLRRLCLRRFVLGDKGLRRLAEGPTLAGLTQLSLEYCLTEPAGLYALVRSPAVARLERFELKRLELDAARVEALLAGWHLPRLRHLRLWFNSPPPAMLAALAAAPPLASLEVLEVGENLDERDLLLALVQSAPLVGLTTLRLSGCVWGAGLAEVLRQARLPRLRCLGLGRRGSGTEATSEERDLGAALGELARRAPLETVNLSTWGIGAGVGEFLSAPGLALRHLGLEGCELTPAAAHLLASSPALTGLSFLDVSENLLGDEGASALARGPSLTRLAVLLAAGCEFGPGGMRELLTASTLAGVEHFDLSLDYCRSEEEGHAELRAFWLALLERQEASTPAERFAALLEVVRAGAPEDPVALPELAALACAEDLPPDAVPAARSALLGHIFSGDASVCEHARQGLFTLRDHPVPWTEVQQAALLDALVGEQEDRRYAVTLLAWLPLPPVALARLLALLEHGRPEVRLTVLQILRFRHYPDGAPAATVEAVSQLLRDPRPEVRTACALTLRKLRPVPEQVRDALRRALGDEDFQVRLEVSLTLLCLGDHHETVADTLAACFRQGPEASVLEGICDLGLHRREEVPEPLCLRLLGVALEHGQSRVRSQALWLLPEFGPEQGLLGVLRAWLAPGHPDQLALLRWLARDGARQAAWFLPELWQLLQEDEEVARAALSALEQAGAAARDLVPDIRQAARRRGLGWYALRALRAAGGPEAEAACADLEARLRAGWS